MKSIAERIAEELSVKTGQVAAAIGLLDEGSTVPFIARYRKEATGALDDTQLRTLEARLAYLRELEDRRRTILYSVREQGKLDAALEAQINEADTKARLEDIYLPFKPKRRTGAQIARENGLEPLAEALLAQPEREPLAQAEAYVKADAVKSPAGCARRRTGDPGRALRRGRRPHRTAARGLLEERADRLESAPGQGGGGSEIRRLFRLLRAARENAVASGARAHARRTGGGS